MVSLKPALYCNNFSSCNEAHVASKQCHHNGDSQLTLDISISNNNTKQISITVCE